LSRGAPGGWDDGDVAKPCVLQLEDDSYLMWYTGRDGSTSRIGLATSTDGVTWQKHSANPIFDTGTPGSWDASAVSDPHVLRDGTRFLMYYTGRGASSRSVGLATSSDGVSWSRSAANPVLTPVPAGSAWDDEEVLAPWVLRDGASYAMWYTGLGDYLAIGHASSTDGMSWSRLLSPVLHPQVLEALTFSPCVILNGLSYRIWYAALHETPGGGVFPGVIDFAQSVDGIEWTAHRTVLSPGAPSSWDENAVRAPCVLDDGNRRRMWYEGEDATGSSAIGFATFE
jgi:predicted GH43/DUF377 family glycosyl hydrolase